MTKLATLEGYKRSMEFINRLKTLSVSKLMLIVTILVAVLPISILGFHLYNSAWDNGWREIKEKHQLLAQNLAMPLVTYINDHRGMLSIFSKTIPMIGMQRKKSQVLLSKTLANTRGFRSLILMDMKGRVISYASDGIAYAKGNARIMAKDETYLNVRNSGKWSLSRIRAHPVTRKPSLFMGEVVRDNNNRAIGVLLAELKIDYIEKIRKQVKFGEKGHSAIVDQTGHVVAHPNAKWMAEIKDISSWPIVQSMMAGKTGATSFYSPFMKGNMVAGYAAVPDIGWGIMVPQPESEVAEQVNILMRSHFIWGVTGLIIAIFLALCLSRWLTDPLDKLARAGRHLMQTGLDGNLPAVSKTAPKEIMQVSAVLRVLISSLQLSRKEVQELNESLQCRVDNATHQLREVNMRLEVAAQSDYLTEIANRRYFEDCLYQALSRRSGDVDHFCVMLIDIDHFKQINDTYGHAAGDVVLNQVARILERGMRSGDLVARYGGDEFVVYMRCDRDIGFYRANEIHAAIEHGTVQWNEKSIHITASVGMYCRALDSRVEINDVLRQADEAMYKAKRLGRNRVIDIGG